MSRVLEMLARHASERPDTVALQAALEPGKDDLNWRALAQAVDAVSVQLKASGTAVAAMLFDNSPACVIADLALIDAAIPCVPLPHFFSPQQHAHTLKQAGVGLILSDMPGQLEMLLAAINIEVAEKRQLRAGEHPVWSYQLSGVAESAIADGIAKITFTSGSTGEPKGVCLRQDAMEQVAQSLAAATDARLEDRHLTVLPFATLLENIGGIYAPILAGATITLPGLREVGLSGASGLDAQKFVEALVRSRATSCIMIPQMLLALVSVVARNPALPLQLRFAAVGGASVSPALLAQAQQLGLPVYEGYGLSEACSVVAVNTPAHNRPGTTGKPLPHVELRFEEDGEILVKGALFSGYLSDQQASSLTEGFWPSGDIGELDEDGYLHITGRKKHMFITAFGRNVAPEWVERELGIEPAIAQACVFGEAMAFNVAVIVPRDAAAVAEAVAAAVAAANGRLPDYAQVQRWLLADAPFSVENGQWTGTGRPRREHIWQHYRQRIEALPAED